MMLNADKRRIVEHLVRDVYLQEIKNNTSKMMNKFTEKLQKDIMLSQAIGMPVNIDEPVLFEVSEPTIKLIENLMVIFDDDKNIGLS